MKLPRDVSGRDVLKALRRLGFTFTRQQGSHIRMSKGGHHVTIPNHRTILPKTLHNVLVRPVSASMSSWMRCRFVDPSYDSMLG